MYYVAHVLLINK